MATKHTQHFIVLGLLRQIFDADVSVANCDVYLIVSAVDLG